MCPECDLDPLTLISQGGDWAAGHLDKPGGRCGPCLMKVDLLGKLSEAQGWATHEGTQSPVLLLPNPTL